MAIEIKGLSHQFPNGRWGLKDINLTIEKGSWVLLTGSNGSGKTLLMKHLAVLIKPTHGYITIDNQDIQIIPDKARQEIGLVFQDSSSQILGITVEEEAAFGPRNLGLKKSVVRERVKDALAAVGLSGREEELCFTLSGGEKRRLALAGILTMNPSTIILDEPFTGLDYPGVLSVMKILKNLHNQGKTIILITHELEKCLGQTQKIVLMDKGEILGDGTVEELWETIPKAGVYLPAIGSSAWRSLTWLD